MLAPAPAAALCLPGLALTCDDGNPCTFDRCEGGVCAQTWLTGVACDDGDGCTVGDH